ncbi:hypothetical protein N7478_008006 [Penicillium angulare]|uniref:uncharacterized protein n=1 Tax=Penicillium angulare TaxID=116970 RepID=UPI0025424AF4|nr:uncharacterized protein N7478_008006 [Penicillium angulare]KAJ5272881.1 hypothetical protein N7478_008006 [Penicillium angulare]
MRFSSKIARPLQLVTRALQWSSSVIVMGLTSYFIMKGPHGQHILYQDVIKENPTQAVVEKHDGTCPPLDAPAEVAAPVAEA